MKKVILIFTVFYALVAYSQVPLAGFGGEYGSRQEGPCLTDAQRAEIQERINKNRERLISEGVLIDHMLNKMPMAHPLFSWPLKKDPASPFNETWSVGNYVDDNIYDNQLTDWNCGSRTYDNHKGIDIGLWPFPWMQFQKNLVCAVAAAPGIIVDKFDGNFDMNCSCNGSWNSVCIQHSDGSIAWYGHFKKYSLTAKEIGESVAEGEYLGVVGSSGCSPGVHLHFEVYNANGQLVDPFAGPCNNWTSSTDSWWKKQPEYNPPNINAVLTHNALPVDNTCPDTETANLKDNFTSGSTVIAVVYLTNQLANSIGIAKLIRPNGSIAYTYYQSFANFNYSSWWYWTFASDTLNQQGLWTFSYTYLGNTVNHKFSYGMLGSEEFSGNLFSVYPNPSKNIITIKTNNNNEIEEVSLFDMVGKKVFYSNSNTSQVDLSSLAKGVYLIHIVSDNHIYKNKIIKE